MASQNKNDSYSCWSIFVLELCEILQTANKKQRSAYGITIFFFFTLARPSISRDCWKSRWFCYRLALFVLLRSLLNFKKCCCVCYCLCRARWPVKTFFVNLSSVCRRKFISCCVQTVHIFGILFFEKLKMALQESAFRYCGKRLVGPIRRQVGRFILIFQRWFFVLLLLLAISLDWHGPNMLYWHYHHFYKPTPKLVMRRKLYFWKQFPQY